MPDNLGVECMVTGCTKMATIDIHHVKVDRHDKFCPEHGALELDILQEQGKVPVPICQWKLDDGTPCPNPASGVAVMVDENGNEEDGIKINMCEQHFHVFQSMALGMGKAVDDRRSSASN